MSRPHVAQVKRISDSGPCTLRGHFGGWEGGEGGIPDAIAKDWEQNLGVQGYEDKTLQEVSWVATPKL